MRSHVSFPLTRLVALSDLYGLDIRFPSLLGLEGDPSTRLAILLMRLNPLIGGHLRSWVISVHTVLETCGIKGQVHSIHSSLPIVDIDEPVGATVDAPYA